MDMFCLVIWILNLIIAVIETIGGEPINPFISICAMVVCVLHFLEKTVG